MLTKAVKEKIKALHLEELRKEEIHWFYISFANTNAFLGGYFVRAQGPTDALRLAHDLGFYPGQEAESQTNQIPDDLVVPDRVKYTKLSGEDVRRLELEERT